jgi:hypothetical protein
MNTSKLLKKAFCISALPLLLALSTGSVGCLGHSGASDVAQGQRYQSGDPTYDQFFENVHELSVKLSSAPKTEGNLRMALAKEVGVEPEEDDPPMAASTPAQAAASTPEAASPTDAYKDQLQNSAINAVPGGAAVNSLIGQFNQIKASVAQVKTMGAATSPATEPTQPSAPAAKREPKAPSAPLIAKAVQQRSEKLGFEMKLRVERTESKAKVLTRGDAADGIRLARLVEKTAEGELKLAAEMQAAKKKLSKLASIGAALEANADSTFRKSRAKASEVKKNLTDAKALIELMESRADAVAKDASQMVDKLQLAAAADIDEAGPAEAAPTQPAEKPATAAKAKERAAAPKAKESAKHPEPPRPRTPAPAGKTVFADFEP